MSPVSIPKGSIRAAVAGLIFVGLLSPANATNAAAIFPDRLISGTADHASKVLTSHLPWLAPVGHRQPHRADAPQSEAVSEWERQQQRLDRQLDRKLIICRGC
jgi:hypothetical protein